MPIMSAEEFWAYLRKTYPQLTVPDLLQMCSEAGYELTPPLPATELGKVTVREPQADDPIYRAPPRFRRGP
jgi:hypothetical protein